MRPVPTRRRDEEDSITELKKNNKKEQELSGTFQ